MRIVPVKGYAGDRGVHYFGARQLEHEHLRVDARIKH
jgi:hypothetical protein